MNKDVYTLTEELLSILREDKSVMDYEVTFKKGEFENNVTKVTVDHENRKVVLG